ncbi:MAG: AMP-binding enzyme, partial [Coprobacter sp.]
DDRGCLCIHTPHLSNAFFVTNDIVRLSGKTSFEWLGRFDNVINSGGVKLFPEEIEKRISELIPDKRFYVTGVSDERLGEKAVLMVEDQNWTQEKIVSFMKEVRSILSPYQIPKEIRFVSNFRETYSGKIVRDNQE